MARIRSLKPEFFDDEDVAKLSFAARLCFQGLWVWADRRGVLEDRPARLKARIFPFDDVDMNELLRELERGRFIVRYANGEHACIQVRTFVQHQKPHPKEPVSDLPNLSDEGSKLTSPEKKRQAVKKNGQSGGLLSLGSGFLSLGSGSGGLGSSEALPRSEPAVPPSEPDGPTALRFPTVGHEASWALSEAQLGLWAKLFPALDVRAESQSALAWVLAKPQRRKTARGMPAFLVGWFGRSNDRRPSGAAAPLAGPVTRGERVTAINQQTAERLAARYRSGTTLDLQPVGAGADPGPTGLVRVGGDS